MKKLLTILLTLLSVYSYSQCFSDNCIDSPSQTTAVPGCCTGTTAGMTNSYSTNISGCANLSGGLDTWITFMAPSNGYLSINFTSITIGGTVNMVVFDSFSNADNCATLNAGGIIAACESFPSSTPPNPISLNYVQTGERYFILISSPPGSTPGSFEVCLSVVVPTGGMDCPDATSLCSKDQVTLNSISTGGGSISGDGTFEDLDLGPGSANNQLSGSCLGSGPGDGGGEVNSQWYIFTAGTSGTLKMAIYPLNTTVNCAGPTVTGDDYDFILLDISKSGLPYYTCNIQNGSSDSATVMQCDWSGQNGVTGFGLGGPNSMGYFGTSALSGQGGCQTTDAFAGASTTAWNSVDVNLVCGNTYALMISNYTGASTSGFQLNWGGTALFGVQTANITDPVISNCSVTSVITAPLCGGSLVWSYKYLINWGDGNTTTATSTNLSHTYAASGTYTITMLVTDPSGCQEGISKTVTVSCIALPVELFSFTGDYIDSYNNLQWKTASELNNDYFTIERSIDGVNWIEVTRKDGVGNSSFTITYNHQDYDFVRGKVNYYKLSQTDFDGTKETFKIISINNTESVDNVTSVKIYDLLGREYNEILDSGTYIIVTYYQSGKMESKMIRK